ncbi:hypothetical protein PY650_35715 [Rhizobium calliandrae]|uniref:Uncharacterized protein n=1 Tax=Rhizobium calliandrae TaxID=1312182 RepID=A0ABT7KT32_9HYPH|nr:hypothetical protein [Rhizobium calliandrae]MDL2410798.1 hypothetical protein [Rhizobium calliandrae]
MSDWRIPDWASVIGFIWAVGATVINIAQYCRKRQSDVLAHRFLSGLKASATEAQIPQINDEMERIKPSNKGR